MLVTLVPAGILLLMCLWAHLRLQSIIYWSSKVSADPQTPQKAASVCKINIYTQNSCKKCEGCMTVTGNACPRSPPSACPFCCGYYHILNKISRRPLFISRAVRRAIKQRQMIGLERIMSGTGGR